jgi:hypothetical protein
VCCTRLPRHIFLGRITLFLRGVFTKVTTSLSLPCNLTGVRIGRRSGHQVTRPPAPLCWIEGDRRRAARLLELFTIWPRLPPQPLRSRRAACTSPTPPPWPSPNPATEERRGGGDEGLPFSTPTRIRGGGLLAAPVQPAAEEHRPSCPP